MTARTPGSEPTHSWLPAYTLDGMVQAVNRHGWLVGQANQHGVLVAGQLRRADDQPAAVIWSCR
jgi:hypothetical protein